MKTNRIPTFYIILLIIAAIVIIITQIGKFYLNTVLAEYEDSQYKYVAEEFFNDNFNDSNSESLTQLFAAQISDNEKQEAITTFFSELTRDKNFTLQHSSSGLSDEEKYVVSIDNLKFAEFYLTRSNEKTKHGFDTYEVSEVLLNDNLLNTYTIRIPLGYSVMVNGSKLNGEYALGDRIETESQKFMPDGIDGIIYTTYKLTNMCHAPEFKVLDSSGKDSTITLQDDGVYSASVIYNNELADKYYEYVIDATKAYACYMQKDASFSKVGKYLDPKSEFYKYVKGTPTWPVITHNSYNFENENVTEFYAYNDEVFSCRVTLTHVLKYSGLDDYRDNIDITWYFKNVDGKFLIYDSFTH